MKVAAIIPAYRAEETLGELIARTSKYIDCRRIVVVDDGSPDGTYDLASKAGVVALRHAMNQGKGEALRTGFRYALGNGYDGVVCLDADLQHDPDAIPHFLRLARERQADVVIGTRARFLTNMPFSRWLTNSLTSIIISCFSGRLVRDSQSGYRYLSRRAIQSIRVSSSRYDFESEFLFKSGQAGFRVWEVPIPTIYTGSHSYINPLVDTGRFVRLMWRSLLW